MVAAIHLIFAGIWLGCIVVEVLFERALIGKGREQELILARLHKRVDLVVEIPAFLIVLLTGALVLSTVEAGALLYTKAGLGLIAVIANIYCVRLVFCRADAAEAGDWLSFERYDHLQHKVGAVVLLSVVVASIIGVSADFNA